jgi:hypothetical protein
VTSFTVDFVVIGLDPTVAKESRFDVLATVTILRDGVEIAQHSESDAAEAGYLVPTTAALADRLARSVAFEALEIGADEPEHGL